VELAWNDLRLAVRGLLRDRGFAAVAVLTLAVGIGANTAIFSVVNSVILQPLAYHQPERLFAVQESIPSLAHLYPALPVNARHFTEWRRQCRSFEGISIIGSATLNLTGSGEPERLEGARVSAGLFKMLGVQPALGRDFLPEEDAPGHERVVMLADSLWRRRFAADPGIVGRTISLDGLPHTVVGIIPASFRFPERGALGGFAGSGSKTEVFKPIAFTKDDLEAPFGEFNYAAIARLRRGVTPQQAVAEMQPIQTAFARMVPDKLELKAVLSPLRDEVVGQVGRGLVILLAAVGAVLLIVCVNLANLMLARATARARDAAIRSALGASRWRILRQTLTESALLGTLGGALGIALAFWGVSVLVRTAPIDLPRLDEVRIDGNVLAFAVCISALSSILFGLLPAWRLTGSDPQRILGAGSRGNTEGRYGVRLRGLLVSFEVGLSAVLLITAGLLMTSFMRLMNVDQGFRTERVLAAEIKLPSVKYQKKEDRIQFCRNMLSKVEAIPGVLSAGVVSLLPLQGERWVDVIWPEGDPKPLFRQPITNYRFVSPGYFEAMGIPLKLGRGIAESDQSRPVALVSELTAKRVWPGENPLGKRFRRGNSKDEPFELIGLVGETRTSIQKDPGLTAYVPYWYRIDTGMSVVVKTAMEPEAAAGALRSAVWAVDSEIPVSRIRTMREVVSRAVAQRRFQMQLVAGVAIAAMLLASVGIFGVVSYTVARRRNEIAIRMALGAAAGDVHRLVLREGLTPVAAGLAAGIAAALALGRVLQSLPFGVTPRDPVTIAAVAALLAVVAAAACYLPALRATRVAPSEALRYQ
jgi:predicted permease